MSQSSVSTERLLKIVGREFKNRYDFVSGYIIVDDNLYFEFSEPVSHSKIAATVPPALSITETGNQIIKTEINNRTYLENYCETKISKIS